MADAGDIIDYIKTLKKGFDKDLFQNKIDELAYIADTTGLNHREFHTLLKIWLNLTIPLTKWTSLGACLVPQEMIEEHTVDYVFQWILANYGNQNNFSKIGFVLDWLTVAMECECIDMTALDLGYELFYSMLTYEALTPHVMKLMYTLTKPSDVTRKRVTELFEYAKIREGKKNMFRQLQVLLGLFKSYKPECVPEDVPAISIHTAFKKLNVSLVSKFRKCQARRNHMSQEKQYLMWTNPINAERGRNKKADPLVPNMEFFNIGSRQYADKEPTKNYLDFSEPVSLVRFVLQHGACRPARLRALLTNETGLTLLALASHAHHAFLSHDLHHLLNICFLDVSPHSYAEKQDLLHRLALLQRTLMQGIPVITRFLAQYLPLWNERDYFAEILELVEWVSVDCPDHMGYIVGPLTRTYHRAQPMEQCAILNSLTNMYTNLVYTSTRSRQHFMGFGPPKVNYSLVLPILASDINAMICGKELQANPEDMRVLFSSIWSAECLSEADALYGISLEVLPSKLTLYLPLLSVSALLIEKMAALMMVYKKIFTRMKSQLKQRDETYSRHIQTLQQYTGDMLSWLYMQQAVATHLPPLLADKLNHAIPQLDHMLSIKNHVAFAPYTYALTTVDDRDATNKLWYDSVLQKEFPNLIRFLRKAVPELQ